MFQEGVGVHLQQGANLPAVTAAVKCSACPDSEGLMKALYWLKRSRCDRVRLFEGLPQKGRRFKVTERYKPGYKDAYTTVLSPWASFT